MVKQELYSLHKSNDKVNNFANTLSLDHSDMAKEMFKDKYCLEFLNIQKPVHERELENSFVLNIKDFLLQLGQGYAFVGNQYLLSVGGDDFYIDCLFYNIKMHCYVVLEIKSGKFKPEYLGQLNFYLTAVGRQIKTVIDNQTIGILLCETKNEIVAQYAVDGMTKPMGISEYELSRVLTAKLRENSTSFG